MLKQVLVLVVTLGLAVCRAAAGPEDRTQILKWMKELKPLQKVHYSWAIPESVIDNPKDPRLFEYARITHAVSLNEAATPRRVERAVVICKQVNALNPEPGIPATIAVNYSPWHRVFPKDAPPTDVGEKHQAEINKFRRKLEDIKRWLADANARHQTNIPITAFLLDTERFYVREGDKRWNQAITAKYDVLYDITKELFPGARVEWYKRGIARCAAKTGWKANARFTYDEKGDSFSCSLYRMPEIGYMRETFRRTYDFAKLHGVEDVTPWVALAAGYRRDVDDFHKWHADWDYDLIYAWLIGRELNNPWFGRHPDRFAPYFAAKVIVFYPPPFDPRAPAWGQHFVAYVRGAHMIEKLPLLDRSEQD